MRSENQPDYFKMTQKRKGHRPSKLLSIDENTSLFQLIPAGCQILSAAVIQLLVAEVPPPHQWRHFSCGVVCLLKNSRCQSFFVTVYDVLNAKMLWEQELYLELDYRQQTYYFHTFEGESCVAGMNFADEQEASEFYTFIQQKLRILRQKHGFAGKSEIGKNRKLCRTDIGHPIRESFRHISHIGWEAKNTVMSSQPTAASNLQRDQPFVIANANNPDQGVPSVNTPPDLEKVTKARPLSTARLLLPPPPRMPLPPAPQPAYCDVPVHFLSDYGDSRFVHEVEDTNYSDHEYASIAETFAEPGLSGRDKLLSEISAGIDTKHAPITKERGGISAAFERFLKERRKQVEGKSDGESDADEE